MYWASLYIFTAGAVVLFRVAVPLFNFIRFDLRVAGVVEENHEVVSIYLEGRELDRWRAQSGQFFFWRFLCRGQWWQAHPYSLSAATPWEVRRHKRREWLRISVKDLGRGSGELLDLPVGTRVVAEGPFGTFVAANRTRRRVLLVAGGIGITPVRALLESIPARAGDITLIYRVSERSDLVFMDEIQKIAATRNARVVPIVGSRSDFPRSGQPLSPRHLHNLVPDVRHHDVYVCGPEFLIDRVRRSLNRLGVRPEQVHYETFAIAP
jgi:ferredoxin-NADP reductase